MNAGGSWFDRVWRGVLLGTMTLFVINIGLIIAAVATSSFARRWLGTWLPDGWTTSWYTEAWREFQLGGVLWVTVEIVFAVVFLALLIGVPAAYTLARRDFPGKRMLMLLFLLPLMVPPITYGIPMATLLGEVDLRDDGRSVPGKVVLDLSKLEQLDEAAPLVRYARSIVLERGDWNGRVLSIRKDDVRALGSMLHLDERGLMTKLGEWDVLASPGVTIDLTDAAAVG
jgi:hypothetical protein